ncbi:MAG TPA: serine hydrolase domain-containing protein [Pirellulaceae bacterium]|nr:serine hydrolase domain-containing protein [Pirellulaceae bacterium]HMO92509.1 serine hydrolase domain-containing protein [Pirellulaceae bacterium]HMP69008.1 serine hydrolase domain-containing protein [Pirellulaceae bacterium]
MHDYSSNFCQKLSVVGRFLVLVSCWLSIVLSFASPIVCAQATLDERKAARREFQSLELITSRFGGWIFMPGLPPRIVWRDAEAARQFGLDPGFSVRWFDAELREADRPDTPGRWLSWLEGTAPNGTPFRRSFTLYALPNLGEQSYAPDFSVEFPNFPGDDAPAAWREHQIEFRREARDFLFRGLADHEKGAILVAGIAESQELGRPKRFVEWASTINDDFHLALKLKLLGLSEKVRTLAPPRMRVEPAPIIREGTAAEAGVPESAKAVIDAFCREWCEASGEPFVVLVAKRGVVITHTAFSNERKNKKIDLDYRCWTASITKTITALMFSQFADQGLIPYEVQLGEVFSDYPEEPFVPTFGQLLNHTSGLSGHTEWGGMRNPHLENIVLNGIDVNEPGSKLEYCGQGFELAAKAMEIVTAKTAIRIFHDHLFEPLGFGDVVMGNASSDGEFTALELAILGQWMANRGSYGDWEFIREETFDRMLPRKLNVPGANVEQGYGLHRVRHRRPEANPNSLDPADLLFSDSTFGHGSFSGCILVVDPAQQLVIAQARRKFDGADNDYYARFFQVIAKAIEME